MYGFLKNGIVRAVLIILTFLALYFIFAMSSYNSKDSSELSMGLLRYINLLLGKAGFGDVLTEYVLRKIAHYSEYAVLGGLLFLDVVSFTEDYKKGSLIAPPAGLCIAALDELSQNLSDGRTPKIFDVFIDFCGVFTAVAILYLFFSCLAKNSTE